MDWNTISGQSPIQFIRRSRRRVVDFSISLLRVVIYLKGLSQNQHAMLKLLLYNLSAYKRPL